jgi:hypothetical protein
MSSDASSLARWAASQKTTLVALGTNSVGDRGGRE